MIKAAFSTNPDNGTTRLQTDWDYNAFLGFERIQELERESYEFKTEHAMQMEIVGAIFERRKDITRMQQRDLEESLFQTMRYAKKLRAALDAIALKRRTESLNSSPVGM